MFRFSKVLKKESVRATFVARTTLRGSGIAYWSCTDKEEASRTI